MDLISYIPATVLQYLQENESKLSDAWEASRQSYETCALFCDVSGYTNLCEKMTLLGPDGCFRYKIVLFKLFSLGDETLAKFLNSYFELLIKTIVSFGGDIFKFAGKIFYFMCNLIFNLLTYSVLSILISFVSR